MRSSISRKKSRSTTPLPSAAVIAYIVGEGLIDAGNAEDQAKKNPTSFEVG